VNTFFGTKKANDKGVLVEDEELQNEGLEMFFLHVFVWFAVGSTVDMCCKCTYCNVCPSFVVEQLTF